ncbi:PREDICTED: uncharacterized protein LOC109179535 isoform X2 [Ipomoea nil]|uniref:uncharacterized protein LOC109179535 isoform X2 n=1 Tax=Ipomoea nil TaxID=35883 RepID=UPI000901C433|nr:PREDICTED: uncharacterized protein LOC109179535 isoform X2 [Ipomoea nil]
MKVGRPVKVDYTTSLISKGKFARVCIEVDISKPLLAKYTLSDTVWPIVYEGLHLICFGCGLYGHRLEHCGKIDSEDRTAPEEVGAEQMNENLRPEEIGQVQKTHLKKSNQDYASNYGSWMLVQRKERCYQRRVTNKPENRQIQPPGIFNKGPTGRGITEFEGMGDQSCFTLLADLDGNEDDPVHDNQAPMEPVHDNQTPMEPVQAPVLMLPRIRTNFQQGQAPRSQPDVGGAQMARQPAVQLRAPFHAQHGSIRGRLGRGGPPRRAADEAEHTVVRGTNHGRDISRAVVHHANDQSDISPMVVLENTCRNDPPDIAKVFDRLAEPPDEAMADADKCDGLIGPGENALSCS